MSVGTIVLADTAAAGVEHVLQCAVSTPHSPPQTSTQRQVSPAGGMSGHVTSGWQARASTGLPRFDFTSPVFPWFRLAMPQLPLTRVKTEWNPEGDVKFKTTFASTVDEKVDLLLSEIDEFSVAETPTNLDDTVVDFWRDTIHSFVSAYPVEFNPVSTALSRAKVIDTNELVETGSRRGRLIKLNIPPIGVCRALVVYDESGAIQHVALSRFHGLGNIEELGDDFFEVPQKYRDTFLETLGDFATKKLSVARNPKAELLVPTGYTVDGKDVSSVVEKNPILRRLVSLLPVRVGFSPRLGHFNVRTSSALALQKDGIIFQRVEHPFDGMSATHELIHALWTFNCFSLAQKAAWKIYVQHRYPDTYGCVREYYSKSVMLRSKFDDRASDEMLAYMFQVLAHPELSETFWSTEIDQWDLAEFAKLGLIDESEISDWTAELARRKAVPSPV